MKLPEMPELRPGVKLVDAKGTPYKLLTVCADGKAIQVVSVDEARAFALQYGRLVREACAQLDGAREARANPDATEHHFGRAADGYTKRVFAEVDPAGDQFLSDIPEFEHAIKPSKPWPRTGGTKA